MPSTLDELISILDLETIDVGLFRGCQPDTRLQRVFGGQVAAQALVAAGRTVEASRAVHSLHGYFLRPGDTSVPIVYDVESVRDGGSFSMRRVVARQHGRSIFYLSASFQKDEQGLDHQDAMPSDPAVPDPESCPPLDEVMAGQTGVPSSSWEREWAALEVRFAGDSGPGGVLSDGRHPARARVWLRAAGDLGDIPAGDLQHVCLLVYASDLTLLASSLVPHGTYIGAPGLQSASLDHAMWFHRPFRADEWLLYDEVSPSATGGRGLASGRVFTRDGRLVATVMQEGLIRQVAR
ncbi:MAG: acyl-CoA thioesterase [Actinomycetes bacterium]